MSKTVWIINQYASTPSTGMGGRHYYLARELAKKGHDVYVIGESNHHLLRRPPKFSGLFEVEPLDGFKFVWVKMPSYSDAHSRKRVLNWLLFPWKIRKLSSVIRSVPDVVICSSPSPIAFLGAQSLAKKFGAKLVFEVRDIWPLTLTEIGGFSELHPFIRFMQWVEDKAYRDSDCVISNLKNSVDHMVARGLDARKFSWVANGFSLAEVHNKEPLEESVIAAIPRGKFIVGYTGTIGVANALDSLVCAAKLLKDYDGIHFVIVGDGKERERLVADVVRKGLDNVSFIPSIPKAQIQSMLSLFSVCYIGLTRDPLFRFGVSPNKLFDYLYSGKPVLYAIDSGKYRPIDECGAGLQVEPENPENLAEAVLHLYHKGEEDRLEMGRNGRAAALNEYEYGVLAAKLESAIFS